VVGFYALSPVSIEHARIPDILRRGLGPYEVLLYRLGRLATDRTIQGQGLGGKLILATAERALLVAEHVGGVVLLIDAKNRRAVDWYRSYGAIPLADAELTQLLPLKTEAAVIAAAEK
jgi:GNAT superfamily N-acetyltransferase